MPEERRKDRRNKRLRVKNKSIGSSTWIRSKTCSKKWMKLRPIRGVKKLKNITSALVNCRKRQEWKTEGLQQSQSRTCVVVVRFPKRMFKWTRMARPCQKKNSNTIESWSTFPRKCTRWLIRLISSWRTSKAMARSVFRTIDIPVARTQLAKA